MIITTGNVGLLTYSCVGCALYNTKGFYLLGVCMVLWTVLNSGMFSGHGGISETLYQMTVISWSIVGWPIIVPESFSSRIPIIFIINCSSEFL